MTISLVKSIDLVAQLFILDDMKLLGAPEIKIDAEKGDVVEVKLSRFVDRATLNVRVNGDRYLYIDMPVEALHLTNK